MLWIKWAGGKTWLWNKAHNFFTENNLPYVEPFAGGGSIFINLLKYCNQNNIKREFYINDLNDKLIGTYLDIKNNVETLIENLENIEPNYYQNRDKFNELPSCIERSALFIWLNKSCYRGLFRVNRQGKFNTPESAIKPIRHYGPKQLREMSLLFNKFDVKFSNLDYEDFVKDKEHCMIYLDPPYYNTFDGYVADKFDYNRFNETLL